MISNAILYIVFGALVLLTSPFRLLADVSLPSGMTSSLAQIGGYFNSVSSYLPISTILTVFGIFIAIEGYIFAYKMIKWVRRLGA